MEEHAYLESTIQTLQNNQQHLQEALDAKDLQLAATLIKHQEVVAAKDLQLAKVMAKHQEAIATKNLQLAEAGIKRKEALTAKDMQLVNAVATQQKVAYKHMQEIIRTAKDNRQRIIRMHAERDEAKREVLLANAELDRQYKSGMREH